MHGLPNTTQPLPAPPNLENALLPKAKKIMPSAGCCFLGMAVGTIIGTPFLLGGLTPCNAASLAPPAVCGGVASLVYNLETNRRNAERETVQEYLNTVHRHVTSQPMPTNITAYENRWSE